MTAGMADWEARDWRSFRDFFGSFAPSGMPTVEGVDVGGQQGQTGFLGIFPETQFIQPQPMPSGTPTRPTIYGRYSFDHGGATGTLEGTEAPARSGVLSTAIRLEVGADDVWVRGPGGVYLQLRQHMLESSTESFALLPEGVTERHGQDGDFVVYVLRTRFTACN